MSLANPRKSRKLGPSGSDDGAQFLICIAGWQSATGAVENMRGLPATGQISQPLAGAVLVLIALTACEEKNTYVPPPPPKVTVATPIKRTVTRYLQATGNTAAINTADLVARVSGFIESINYNDGEFVKKGTVLFTIEPETYKLKLDQAKAGQQSAEATLTQAETDYERNAALAKTNAVSQSSLDSAIASRDTARANLTQAKINTELAAMNYSYSSVTAPFDGIASARTVSIGAYVGGNGTPTVLATIVQSDPIYVNFNVNEQDVLRVRAEIRRLGLTSEDLKKVPVEVGLQIENGYPHIGHLDYASPTIDSSTGTLAARAVLPNPGRVMLPGLFVRVRVPTGKQENALLVPDAALGTDQSGRYLLVVGKDNVVEQHNVEVGVREGTLRVINKGIKADDRIIVSGLLRAVPGQKVDPHNAAAMTGAK
jgi:RND family efflux transporter MFP subunit